MSLLRKHNTIIKSVFVLTVSWFALTAFTDFRENRSPNLQGTQHVANKAIVILAPDSVRFSHLVKVHGQSIYEVDSDFAFGFTAALDSFSCEDIQEIVTHNRYIELGKNNPILVDRDTFNYALLLYNGEKNT